MFCRNVTLLTVSFKYTMIRKRDCNYFEYSSHLGQNTKEIEL